MRPSICSSTQVYLRTFQNASGIFAFGDALQAHFVDLGRADNSIPFNLISGICVGSKCQMLVKGSRKSCTTLCARCMTSKTHLLDFDTYCMTSGQIFWISTLLERRLGYVLRIRTLSARPLRHLVHDFFDTSCRLGILENTITFIRRG